jgi:hypothetical protein
MSKIDDAREFLISLNMPKIQQNDLCCLTLLALAAIKEQSVWADATNEWNRIHDIIEFTEINYGIKYAENSRETFRKTALHNFRNAAIIEDNGSVINSPNFKYRITNETLNLLQTYNSTDWDFAYSLFIDSHQSLTEIYSAKRDMLKTPILINNQIRMISSGKHNPLQKSILEEFSPRFAPFSTPLYVADAAKKDFYIDEAKLRTLKFSLSVHDKLPDIIRICSQAKAG